MARMVFGNMVSESLDSLDRRSVTHFAVERTEHGYKTACNRTVTVVSINSSPNSPDEDARRIKGARSTSCKACRRQMGWTVAFGGKVLNAPKVERPQGRTPPRSDAPKVGRPLIDVLADDEKDEDLNAAFPEQAFIPR